ncbi:MAG: hypothetical protein NTY01_01295 [Verrucomicrobia bacterium]|nr:hypothetical protein [Verrucomicrobiota bacterium]
MAFIVFSFLFAFSAHSPPGGGRGQAGKRRRASEEFKVESEELWKAVSETTEHTERRKLDSPSVYSVYSVVQQLCVFASLRELSLLHFFAL